MDEVKTNEQKEKDFQERKRETVEILKQALVEIPELNATMHPERYLNQALREIKEEKLHHLRIHVMSNNPEFDPKDLCQKIKTIWDGTFEINCHIKHGKFPPELVPNLAYC